MSRVVVLTISKVLALVMVFILTRTTYLPFGIRVSEFRGLSHENPDGIRVGKFYKFSKKGFFCSSWEGVLKTEGLTAWKYRMRSGEFNFSVIDDSVVSSIQQAMQSGRSVDVTYVKKFLKLPCTHDSKYVITGIRYIY